MLVYFIYVFIIFQGQEKNLDFKAIWATLKRRLVKPKMKTKMKFEAKNPTSRRRSLKN